MSLLLSHFCIILKKLAQSFYQEKYLSSLEYEIKENEHWVRVEARDAEGRQAWSNIVVL